MASNLAIVWIILQIGTKWLEIEANLPWGTIIKSYINFQMATLNLTLDDLSRIKLTKDDS